MLFTEHCVTERVEKLKYLLVGDQFLKNENLRLNIAKTNHLVNKESAAEYL